MTCIGEPISWLRLELHARAADAAVGAHLAECAACRACADAIVGDAPALPALVVPSPRRRTPWWLFAAPALAAAALAILVLRPRPRPDNVASVKGVGEVIVDVQRERAGAIRDDVRTFRPGDRWHVVVTCPPEAHAQIAVEVRDGKTVDRPLPAATLACGNRVTVPGAFELTGDRPNAVCARVTGDDDTQTACVTVSPE